MYNNYNTPITNPYKNVYIFGTTGTTQQPGQNAVTAFRSHEFQLPECTMVHITCIGAGAGGNGAGVAVAAAGGGGGGSGAISTVLIPRVFLPHVVYVTVGPGGLGGNGGAAAGTQAGIGGQTFVTVIPNERNGQFTTVPTGINTICRATGGNSNATIATGGTAGGVTTAANQVIGAFYCGGVQSLAGQAGANGTSTAGASVTYPTTGLLISGGAGGGGSTGGAGGNVTMVATAPVKTVTGGTTGDNQGEHGNSWLNYDDRFTSFIGIQPGIFRQFNPSNQATNIVSRVSGPFFISTGGGGAGGINGSGTINVGGNGGIGSGGGGGGGSTSVSSAGGRGGYGGNGLCIIVCW